MRRLCGIGVALAAMPAAVIWTGAAEAARAIRPAAGVTTGTQTVFAASRDPGDTPGQIYVASDAEMDADFAPVHGTTGCSTLSNTGQGVYYCTPATLAPGAYYWWFTYLHPTTAFPVRRCGSQARLRSPSLTRRSSLQTTVHPSPGPVVSTTTEGDYSCTNTDAGVLLPIRYAWWVVVQTRETAWIVGPRHFSVDLETAILEVRRHIKEEARLPATAHFVARSVQQTVLARAARAVSKRYGKPMNVAVACWNEDDWRFFEATRDLYGFWVPYMPHWVQLSPAVCGDLERLVYHRGPDRFNHAQMIGLNTLTHEMVHALGVNKGPDMEAKAQCYAMQLSPYMGTALGVPWEFGYRLAHWQVALLWEMPSYYRKRSLCHEGGAWDLDRKHPSPPWHDVRT